LRILAGTTAAFGAQGRRLLWHPARPGTALVHQPLATRDTPFDRYGDWLPAARIAAVVMAMLAISLAEARAPGDRAYNCGLSSGDNPTDRRGAMTEDVEKAGRAASAPHPKDKHPQRPAAGAAARPGTRLDGDLEAMVASNPDFRISWRGYDQLQVDNYVAWGDTELRSSRAAQDQTMRASTETATRLGACQFELEQTRQDLAEARAAAATQVSERLRQILHLAAEEAEELRAGGQDEAERIRAAADANADEIVEHAERKAQAIMEEAGAQHDRIATEAQQLRADAARLLEEAKAEAARLIDDAQAEAESLRDAGHQPHREHDNVFLARRKCVLRTRQRTLCASPGNRVTRGAIVPVYGKS